MLILAHTTSTIAMCAVIWFVQLVHYPLFARVGPSAFKQYETEHVRRITWIVAPLMLIELVSSGWLVARDSSPANIAGLALVGVIWASTLLVQVPLHTRLSEGFDEKNVQRLVRSNWIRTLAWSARLGIVFATSSV
ncbi:MAG: hypothetical protein ACI9KE_002552 [Polyangiales bacterium]|jgi:hypothetical protein